MKKFILLFAIVIFQQQLFAQNSVGIGTNSPNASAALEVYSGSKGVLLPKIYLQNVADNTTIASPATGLLVYNTNASMTGGTGFFYNDGTAASAHWTRVGDLVLPYYQASSSASNSFQIENYSASLTSAAIRGYGGGKSMGVIGEANSGTGVFAKSIGGSALETNGKVKFAGLSQSPAQGKVLTSDADGNATWEGAVAFSTSGIASGNDFISSNTITKVIFKNKNYDLGGNYNMAAAVFTAPAGGIYHFDALLSWASSSITTPGIFLYMKRGATESALVRFSSRNETPSPEMQINKDVQLQAGDQVYVMIRHDSANARILETADTQVSFNGRLVVTL